MLPAHPSATRRLKMELYAVLLAYYLLIQVPSVVPHHRDNRPAPFPSRVYRCYHRSHHLVRWNPTDKCIVAWVGDPSAESDTGTSKECIDMG
jgi:hypothetical protein